MLVVLSISICRLCGLARLTEVQLATAAESFYIPCNHHLVCPHCIITDCQTVAFWGHRRTQCSSCTTCLAPRGWANSYQCCVRVPEQTFSCFDLVASIPRTVTLATRSRVHLEVAWVAPPLTTFPPSCGTRKVHCCVKITPTRALIPNPSELSPVSSNILFFLESSKYYFSI
jgi:hypothetical protein